MEASARPSPRVLDRLSRAPTGYVATWLRRVPQAEAARWAIRIADDVPRQARADLRRGQRLADVACRLARASGDRPARARALRAHGHALALASQHRRAFARYAEAIRLFDADDDQLQVAVTYSGALQTLVYLGRFGRAQSWALRARRIFRRHRDALRLARLESNVGNVYFRQDRFREALACYRRADAALQRHDQHQDAAVAQRNIAVCLTSLNRFDEALGAYQVARQHAEAHGLTLLVAETDYNIAYLHFLCGRYAEALAAYADARQRSEQLGDTYHRTLCDLDEAEVTLELNDLRRARQLAQAAEAGFATLGMRYERAKALAFLATACAREGDTTAALRLFGRARALFVADGNRPWVSAVDLGRATACFRMGRLNEAARGARRAMHRPASGSARILWHVLRGQIALAQGEPSTADRQARLALRALSRVRTPGLAWQVHRVRGEALESGGDWHGAEAAFRQAREALEHLRAHVVGDDLRVSFLEDKLAVYEGLVRLALRTPHREAEALHLIEEAKSRSLAERLAFHAPDLLTRRPRATATADVVRALRQELQAHERRIARESMRTRPDVAQVRRMRLAAAGRERQLVAALSRLRHADIDLASLHAGGSSSIAEIQRALPDGTTILEYYTAKDRIYACSVSRDRLHVADVASLHEVTRLLQLLRFQLATFQLGPDYVRTFASALSAATHGHLRALHTHLIAPVRPWLRSPNLVVVPHGPLHYLPFHALFDGSRYLIDEFVVSYAPSASVYRLCQTQPPSPHRASLVLAVADGYAPHIRHEAEAVARALPDATLRVGPDATRQRLREAGATARYIHVAAHGFFRRDNPMLSAIRLADGDLTLADAYGLSLDADLVTLSGCGTGLSAVIGGDELVGLVRGFLYAGARSLLLTMWQVDDLSTADFMTRFYAALNQGMPRARAAQAAMGGVRDRFAHPYYWAPFMLVGQTSVESDPEASHAQR